MGENRAKCSQEHLVVGYGQPVQGDPLGYEAFFLESLATELVELFRVQHPAIRRAGMGRVGDNDIVALWCPHHVVSAVAVD